MNENLPDGLTRLDIVDAANITRLQELFRYAQVGRCVNGVAHDVNNHLGAAMAYAELSLMDAEVAQETQEQIEKIITAIDKCGKLVNTLTSVARPLGRSANMVDVNALIRGMLMLRDYAFRLAKIDPVLDLAPDLPSLVLDGPKLQLSLLFVILNMEEHFSMTDTRGSISISSRRDGNDLFVEIKSSENTIPESVRAVMFDPYTTSKPYCNIGMGLPFSKSMMQEQNGDLSYDTERGFIFRLPIATA